MVTTRTRSYASSATYEESNQSCMDAYIDVTSTFRHRTPCPSSSLDHTARDVFKTKHVVMRSPGEQPKARAHSYTSYVYHPYHRVTQSTQGQNEVTPNGFRYPIPDFETDRMYDSDGKESVASNEDELDDENRSIQNITITDDGDLIYPSPGSLNHSSKPHRVFENSIYDYEYNASYVSEDTISQDSLSNLDESQPREVFDDEVCSQISPTNPSEEDNDDTLDRGQSKELSMCRPTKSYTTKEIVFYDFIETLVSILLVMVYALFVYYFILNKDAPKRHPMIPFAYVNATLSLNTHDHHDSQMCWL